jgi:hypothetical protein
VISLIGRKLPVTEFDSAYTQIIGRPDCAGDLRHAGRPRSAGGQNAETFPAGWRRPAAGRWPHQALLHAAAELGLGQIWQLAETLIVAHGAWLPALLRDGRGDLLAALIPSSTRAS